MPDAQAELEALQKKKQADAGKAGRRKIWQDKLDAAIKQAKGTGEEKRKGLRAILGMVGHVEFWSRPRSLVVTVKAGGKVLSNQSGQPTIVEIGHRVVQFEHQNYICKEPEVLEALIGGADFGRTYFWIEDAPEHIRNLNESVERAEKTHKIMLRKEIAGELPGHSIPSTMDATPCDVSLPDDGGA